MSAHTAEGVKGTLQFTVWQPVTSIQIEGNQYDGSSCIQRKN